MYERNIPMKIFIKSIILIFLFTAAHTDIKAQVTYQYAQVQIAHNCADSTLDTLDLYVNGIVLDSNVVYHSATGMFPYRSDTSLTIGVAYKHSDGNPTFITSATFPPFGGLLNDSDVVHQHRYAFIISGVNSSNFAPNPDGKNTGISIQEIADIDSAALDTGVVDIRFFQGVTDLPGISIRTLNGGHVFVDSLQYGQNSLDVSIRHTVYEFLVTSPDGVTNYGTFYADLSGLSAQSVVILSSGFLNPQANDSGPAFGLYLLTNTGAVYILPLETSGFQILHNSADPAADSLDIYINGNLTFHNLGFRNATQTFFFNAHATYNIGIAPKNSSSVADTIWQRTFTFPRDTFFIATISGLLSQTGFAPNPDGISTGFQVLLKTPARLSGSSQSNFDFFMLNGVTDAPGLNLVPTGGPLLLSNVEYTDQTNYVSLPSEFYSLNVQNTSGNTFTSGFANFLAFPGQSGVLLTSGFLNPAANNNGPEMNLYMVPTTGGQFIPLFGPSGINDINTKPQTLQIFPNPATSQLHITFALPQPQPVTLQITDLSGNVVKQILNSTTLSGSQAIIADVNNLSQGLYFSRLITSSGTINSRFAIVR